MSDLYPVVTQKTCQNVSVRKLDHILDMECALELNRPGALTIVLPDGDCGHSVTYSVDDFSDSDLFEIWLQRWPRLPEQCNLSVRSYGLVLGCYRTHSRW